MENANLLIAFIAVTAAAVVLQAFLLLGMFLTLRKTGAQVESLATEVRTKALPAIDTVQKTLLEVRPKIESVAENISHSTSVVRSQIERLDAALSDVLNRTRLQVIRADEIVTRTMDKVEHTTETVHRTVVSPFRQISGVMQGVSAGFEHLRRKSRRQSGNGMGVPQDELFI